MVRSARIVVPGLPHHITQRGDHKNMIFKQKKDIQTKKRFSVFQELAA